MARKSIASVTKNMISQMTEWINEMDFAIRLCRTSLVLPADIEKVHPWAIEKTFAYTQKLYNEYYKPVKEVLKHQPISFWENMILFKDAPEVIRLSKAIKPFREFIHKRDALLNKKLHSNRIFKEDLK